MTRGTAVKKYRFTIGRNEACMKIAAFTQTELDYLDIVCNFTDDEQQLFWLRSKDIPLEQCAEEMNRSVDSIKQLSQRINAKIEREI